MTGSKLETPTTAPMMTVRTTPPEAMLSKKFLREGEIPGPAASAISGMTMEAVRAAAEIPVKALSNLILEALTWSLCTLPPGAAMALDGFRGNGLKKVDERVWLSGVTNDIVEVEAMIALFFDLRSLSFEMCEVAWEDGV